MSNRIPGNHPEWLRSPASYMWNFDGDMVQAYTVWRHAVRLYCEKHDVDISEVFAGGPEGPGGLPGRYPDHSPDPWREHPRNPDYDWPDIEIHMEALRLAKRDTEKRVRRVGEDLAADYRRDRRQTTMGARRRPAGPNRRRNTPGSRAVKSPFRQATG